MRSVGAGRRATFRRAAASGRWRESATVQTAVTSRGTFKPEQHSLQLREAAWSQVHQVRRRIAKDKPFTLYSYRLDPHPGFLVNGHLARQPW